MAYSKVTFSVSVLALTSALASTASAQEVRGPESPASTSTAMSPAAGATAADDPTRQGGLEEIIVTARRVAENQQKVPVAVTAFSGEALQQQSAVRVPDLARLTPGLVIKTASSNATGINVQLRGQFQNDPLATLDPSVGVYVDGFYWSRAYGLNADLLDVQSAQVLRGPQGTLFGRNTTGGAIVLQTNDPVLDKLSGLVSGTYGRYNERGATGIVNLPLGDRFAIRAAGSFLKRDGIGRDLNTNQRLGERDSYNIRVKALGQLTDNFSVLLSGEYFHTDALTRPFQTAFVSPSSPANLEATLETQGLPAGLACFASPAATGACIGQGSVLFNNYIASVQGTQNARLNEDSRSIAKTQTYTGTATLDTFFGAVKFIAGYRKVESDVNIDLEGSPYNIVRSSLSQNLKSYSAELQFTGKAFNDSLDFASGLYYMHESGRDGSMSVALPVVSRIQGRGVLGTTVFGGNVNNDSQGLYFQGTYHFTDQLSATGGVRYTLESKDFTAFNRTLNADTGAIISCSITGANPTDCSIFRGKDYRGVSYLLGLNYQINDDNLLYIKTSKGFRSGGQNLRATGAANAAFIPFKPETARSHEVGLKSEFLDRRVRLNLAGYLTNVSDIQRSTIVVSNGGTQTATIVNNAGKARFYGGEAELTAAPVRDFTISANAAYTHAEYIKFLDPVSGFDRSNERFEQVPKWTFSVAGTYDHDFGDMGLLLRADYGWQGSTPLQAFNFYVDSAGVTHDAITGTVLTPAVATGLKRAMTQRPGGTLNLRAALRFLDDDLEVAAFGRNVLDRRYNNNALFFGNPLYVVGTQKAEPATYGVTVTYKFGQR